MGLRATLGGYCVVSLSRMPRQAIRMSRLPPQAERGGPFGQAFALALTVHQNKHLRCKTMAHNDCFDEYVLFETAALGSDGVPRRCSNCQVNPSTFEYQKHSGTHGSRKESGFCCTACAFSMLMQLANEEASEWAALAST